MDALVPRHSSLVYWPTPHSLPYSISSPALDVDNLKVVSHANVGSVAHALMAKAMSAKRRQVREGEAAAGRMQE